MPVWMTEPVRRASDRRPGIAGFLRARNFYWQFIGSRWKRLAAAERKFAQTMPPLEALRGWLLLFVAAIETKQINRWLVTIAGSSRIDNCAERDYPRRSGLCLSFRQAVSHHLATFTWKLTVLAPPAFVITNLYFPSSVGVTFTEHFGPGESSLATSAPEES